MFFIHGLGTDGGLQSLVLGDPPSPLRARRFATILDALTLALLPAIAAEVCVTSGGVVVATLASLSAAGVGVAVMLPAFRLAPVMLAALGLLRYLRTERARWLALAMLAATGGLLWSFDAGLFAVAGTAAVVTGIHVLRLRRISAAKLSLLTAGAVLLPVVLLVLLRGDLLQFLEDSFVTIPGAIDAIWSLPAPEGPRMRELLFWLADEPGRYYIPLVVYGLVLGLAVQQWRSGDRFGAARMGTVTLFALLLFRSAAGRVDANHTRFALPLFGVVVVAFILEPLARRSRVASTVVIASLFLLVLNVVPNAAEGARAAVSWPKRQTSGVPVTYADARTEADIAALRRFMDGHGPEATFFDFTNARALYVLLERKPPVRCADVMMLSSPRLGAEAMAQLGAHPPAFVVVKAPEANDDFDGISNRSRVPELAAWIDRNYPVRVPVGRFVVATKGKVAP